MNIKARCRPLRLITGFLLSCVLLSGAAVAQEQETWNINVRDADIREFISQVSMITGLTFVIDPRVKGKVTVISSESLDTEAIHELFLSVLRVHGYAAVPAGNIVKIVQQTLAKQSSAVFGEDTPLGPSERMVTRVIHARNVSVDQLFKVLRPIIPPYSHMAAIPNINALIISDHLNNIQRLSKIIAEIDIADEYTIEVVQPRHALAGTIFNQIEGLFSGTVSTGKQSASNAKDQGLRLIVDDQNNSLIMRGKVSQLRKLREWIEKLDKPPTTVGDTRVLHLAHADAEQTAKIITGLIGDTQKQRNQDRNLAPSIQADTSLNALVVKAPPEIMTEITALIDALDVRRTQVLIEAAIVEVSLTDTLNLGVELAVGDNNGNTAPLATTSTSGFIGTFLSSLLGGSSTPGNISSEQLVTAAGGLTQPTIAITRLSLEGLSFGAIIQALETNNNSNLLSTPSILALDNEEAEIIVGQNVPFRTGNFTTTNDGSTNPFTTIRREDVGITLKVTPQISEQSTVRLSILQEVSNIAESQAIGASAASDIITNKRSIQTSILADDQQTIVLGGLIQEDTLKTQRKVPVLGSIPLVGILFRSQSSTRIKRNLLVFLRPTILHDNTETATVTGTKYNSIRELLLDARAFGDTPLPDPNIVGEEAYDPLFQE